MPSLKITYFDIRGRAEPLRLACVVGGLEFEDERIKFPEFQDMKPKLPYASLPTMAIDGKVSVQSLALLRYLGKVTSLYPTDPLTALKVDEILDTFVDFQQCIFRYRGEDKEQLRSSRVKLVEEDIPRYVGGLEKRLEAFAAEGPWLVGDAITIADLLAVNVVNAFKCGILDYVNKDVLDAYPLLKKSYDACMKHPKIVEWYNKHPIPNVTA